MSISTAVIADRFISRSRATDIALIAGGALLTALAAQVQIPMFPVPMTMQTFSVLLVGAALGAGRGALSLSLYLVLGAIGMPVFAGAKTLTGVLPTTGYLIGFVAAAAIIGFFASKGWTKNPIKLALVLALGTVVIYAFGVSGLMLTLGLSFPQAIAGGVAPFVLGDVVKATAAAALLPAVWKLTK